MSFFLSVLGLVMVMEGIPYFAFPEKMKSLLARVPFMQNSSLRAFGITAIMIGLVLIYLARNMNE